MEPLRRWLRRTRRMATHLRHVHSVVDKLEDTYADMRDEYHQDDNKEAIDRAFSQLMDAKMALCNPPAVNGSSENLNIAMMEGGRRKSKSRRGRSRRSHH